jgi:preprotein translocase subunit Sec63
MIDRTDLQLMLLEQICEMGTDELIELFQQITGNEMEVYNEETEAMMGSVETLDIADAPQLKKMLGFFLYALGERVEMPIAE